MMGRSDDRFDNYRAILAKFASVGKCGHPIKRGDAIGWHRTHGAQCANCWAKWSAENAEAALMESGQGNGW